MRNPHCRALYQDLLGLSLKELRERQGEADRAFLTQGITFTVYGDTQGTDRIFPYDLLPRMITVAVTVGSVVPSPGDALPFVPWMSRDAELPFTDQAASQQE